MDRYIRWPEAILLSFITAEAAAETLLHGWISRIGLPLTTATDCGRKFESRLWHHLMTLLGTRRACTTVYHPQSNGMVERFHCQLKVALKAQPNPASWINALPLLLLGIRTAVISLLQLLKWYMAQLYDYQESSLHPQILKHFRPH